MDAGTGTGGGGGVGGGSWRGDTRDGGVVKVAGCDAAGGAEGDS